MGLCVIGTLLLGILLFLSAISADLTENILKGVTRSALGMRMIFSAVGAVVFWLIQKKINERTRAWTLPGKTQNFHA